MSVRLHGDHMPQQCIRFSIAPLLDILEGKADDRVAALLPDIPAPATPYVPVAEMDGCVIAALLEEHAQHIHVQRLAETPWTDPHQYSSLFVYDVPDHQRLVNIIAVCRRHHVIAYSDRQWKLAVSIRFRICTATSGITRYHPCMSVPDGSIYPSVFA